MVLTSVSHWGFISIYTRAHLLSAQLSFLSQDNIGACANQICTDFVRLCTDSFTTLGPIVLSIDPVDSSVSSCDLCASNIDLSFNKSLHVTSLTSRRVRFTSRTVLSDLLGFLVLVFCPCILVNYTK